MKNIKDFQERFDRWKNGERYWDIRGIELPKYDNANKNVSHQEYIFQRPDGTYYSSPTNDSAFTEDVQPVLKRNLSDASTWDFVGSNTGKKYSSKYTDDQLKQMALASMPNSETVYWIDKAGNKHKELKAKGLVPVSISGEASDFAFQTLFNPYQKYKLPNDGDGFVNFANVAPFTTIIPKLGYDFSNRFYKNIPQYIIKQFAKTNTGKRLAEVAMRASSSANPIPILQKQSRYILHNDRKRGFDILKYIISGKKTGPFGRYNSTVPFINGQYKPYTGFLPNEDYNAIIPNANDLIDAYLYNKQIDSRYGLIYKGKGGDFGVHENYIKNNYPEQYNKIQIYETTPHKEYLYDGPPIKENWNISSDNNRLFNITQGPTPNVGGHLESAPNLIEPPFKGQDIWKFKPGEYIKKWVPEKPLIKAGLTFIDNAGTPIIIKTPWLNTI